LLIDVLCAVNILWVGFEVLMATSMKMVVVWGVAVCSLVSSSAFQRYLLLPSLR
jgi:hypothetical protein